MKLKTIVVSMCLLSGTALAGTAAMGGDQDGVSAQAARMAAVLDQNQNKAFASDELPSDWYNRVKVSGDVNVDGYYSNRTSNTTSRFVNNSSSSIDLANADVYVDAMVSCWVKAHLAMSYQTDKWQSDRLANDHPMYTTGDAFVPAVDGTASSGGQERSGLSEGYIQVSNFDLSPFYGRFGRQVVDFGSNPQGLNPVSWSLYQQLTESINDAATFGFVSSMGVRGSVFFDRPYTPTSSHAADPTSGSGIYGKVTVNNWGVALDYDSSFSSVGYNVGASYIHDFADVNFINNLVAVPTGSASINSKPGAEAHISLNYNPFDAAVHYVTATSAFNTANVQYGGTTASPGSAKPAAYDIGMGYSFMTVGHNSRVGLMYEGSKQASFNTSDAATANNGLPQSRWDLGYTIALVDNAGLEFHYLADKDFSVGNGGTGRSSGTFVARVGARFA